MKYKKQLHQDGSVTISNKNANGDGSIYYNESKKLFIGQVSVGRDKDGKLKRKTIYGKTAKEVKDKITNVKAQYNTGNYASSGKLTLNEWVEKWFTTYKVHDYKRQSYENEIYRIRNVNRHKIGNMQIDKIKPIDIQNFINDLQSRLKNKTIANVLILLNGALKQALKENLIMVNPCESISKPKIEKPETVAFNQEETMYLLEQAKENPYYDFFVFGYQSGLRESEICGLQRKYVDFDKKVVYIRYQLSKVKGEYFLDTPKTERGIRPVAMTRDMETILKKYMYGNFVYKDFAFYNPVTKGLLKPSTLYSNIKKIENKCFGKTDNKTFERANFHTLRHTNATYLMVDKNINPEIVSRNLGHYETAFTSRTYVQMHGNDVCDGIRNAF